MARSDGVLDRIGDFVPRLVDVPQPMRFVNHYQVPLGLPHVHVLRPGELVRTEDDLWLIEGIQVSVFDFLIESFRFDDCRGEKELVGQFLTPLLAEVSRADDQ